MAELPVVRARGAFEQALARGPVVLSAPTGSGKSTEVPRWCPAPVLVIEPRRIACRSLAARVAELEGGELGREVGYVVRDERVATERTRIVYATPGIALRDRALVGRARTIVIDELHERSLEVDLLLALLLRARRAGELDAALVAMSATLDAAAVAAHLGGEHVAAEGRAFPVEIRWQPGPDVLPTPEDLPARVRSALASVARDPGDVLVFLPGKAEIERCAEALGGGAHTIVPLHGGLALDEQRRAFAPGARRKVILATNVAETSLTIPGVGVVIDSGLVRRTRYHDGRGYLALAPIAEDSAAQRAGRAGRTGPGVCVRLWAASARLAERTPPEIHRESLVPLVLGAAAWGARPEDLPLLDPPKAHALEAARRDLASWDALEGASLSESGREIFAMPLEPVHARLLVRARAEGCLEDAIDLVAALSIGRPLLLPGDPRAEGCDASALVRAMRSDEGEIDPHVKREALRARARLRRAEGLADRGERGLAIDRDALVRAALGADARLAHVARVRGRTIALANGGTELEVARESALARAARPAAAIVLETRALGAGRDARVLATCTIAVPLATLAKAGLGEDRLGAVSLEGRRAVAAIERVYAGEVIATREETPRGAMARDAIATLCERGSLFREAMSTARERLARLALADRLAQRGHPLGLRATGPVGDLRAHLLARLEALGVESGDDLALLSPGDLLPPELPHELGTALDRDYPASVGVGDATYRASYDLDRREVLLELVRGSRRDAPPAAYLPPFPGLRVCVSGPRGVSVVRERR